MVLEVTPQRGVPWRSYHDFISGAPPVRAIESHDVAATYAVRRGQYIKIGRTSHGVAVRVQQLAAPGSVLCPTGMDETEPLSLVVALTGDRERLLHDELREHRVRGEWFRDCAEVREALAREAAR